MVVTATVIISQGPFDWLLSMAGFVKLNYFAAINAFTCENYYNIKLDKQGNYYG